MTSRKANYLPKTPSLITQWGLGLKHMNLERIEVSQYWVVKEPVLPQ